MGEKGIGLGAGQHLLHLKPAYSMAVIKALTSTFIMAIITGFSDAQQLS